MFRWGTMTMLVIAPYFAVFCTCLVRSCAGSTWHDNSAAAAANANAYTNVNSLTRKDGGRIPLALSQTSMASVSPTRFLIPGRTLKAATGTSARATATKPDMGGLVSLILPTFALSFTSNYALSSRENEDSSSSDTTSLLIPLKLQIQEFLLEALNQELFDAEVVLLDVGPDATADSSLQANGNLFVPELLHHLVSIAVDLIVYAYPSEAQSALPSDSTTILTADTDTILYYAELNCAGIYIDTITAESTTTTNTNLGTTTTATRQEQLAAANAVFQQWVDDALRQTPSTFTTFLHDALRSSENPTLASHDHLRVHLDDIRFGTGLKMKRSGLTSPGHEGTVVPLLMVLLLAVATMVVSYGVWYRRRRQRNMLPMSPAGEKSPHYPRKAVMRAAHQPQSSSSSSLVRPCRLQRSSTFPSVMTGASSALSPVSSPASPSFIRSPYYGRTTSSFYDDDDEGNLPGRQSEEDSCIIMGNSTHTNTAVSSSSPLKNSAARVEDSTRRYHDVTLV